MSRQVCGHAPPDEAEPTRCSLPQTGKPWAERVLRLDPHFRTAASGARARRYGCTVISILRVADSPSGGHGAGAVGPTQKYWAHTRPPPSAGWLGMGRPNSLAPTPLLATP